jgi:hypothetical protein
MLLAMTVRYGIPFSRRTAPEFCKSFRLKRRGAGDLQERGAGDLQEEAQGRPGARCTRGLVCKMHIENAHEHTGSAEAVRPSLRDGFTAYSVLSPVTGLIDTVVPERR